MANSDKNILITPNIGESNKPTINFVGAGNSSVALTAEDGSSGSIAFNSTSKESFSIGSTSFGEDLFNVTDERDLDVFSVKSSGDVEFCNSGGELSVGYPGLELPVRNSSCLPAAEEGSIVYDNFEKSVKIADGKQWTNLSGNSGLVRDGLLMLLDVSDKRSYSTRRTFVKAKIFSVFGNGSGGSLRASNYTVEWSDDNVNWTTAWTGVMSNNSYTGFQVGTNQGDGSYGPHRYWRYVEGSPVTSHHPRCSRIQLTDVYGQDIDIIVYAKDNSVDSGTYIIGTVNYDCTRTFHDVSNNHNSPVMQNSPNWVNIGGGAFQHDNVGTNNFNLDHRSHIINTVEGTVGGWVRWNSVSGQNYVYISYGGNGTSNGFLLQSENGDGNKLEFSSFGYADSATYYNGIRPRTGVKISSLFVGKDIYMVGTWKSGRGSLYINGELINSEYTPSNLSSLFRQDSYLRISSEYNRSRGINGNQYLTHIYNRCLTDSEIRQNYEATRGRFKI